MAETKITTALVLTAYDNMSRKVNDAVQKSTKIMKSFRDMSGKFAPKSPLTGMITTAAVYEIGKQAVEMAEKYEDATIQMRQALTNAAGYVNPLYNDFLKMGDAMTISFKGGKTEMYGLITSLLRTGMEADNITSKFVNSVAQYATVLKMPYADAADMIGRISMMSELAQDDIAKLPDLLSRLQLMGVKTPDDVVQAVGRSGMGVMGLGGFDNMQRMAVIIAQVQKTLGGASNAGRGMQIIMSKLSDPARMMKFNNQLAAIGVKIQLFDKSGKFLGLDNLIGSLGQVPKALRMQLFGKFFGARGATMAASLADLGIEKYNSEIGKMMNQQSLAKRSMEYQKRASYQLSIAMSALKGTLTKVGIELIPVFTKIANIVKILVWRFQEWYGKNKAIVSVLKYIIIAMVTLKGIMMVVGIVMNGAANIMMIYTGALRAYAFTMKIANAVMAFSVGAFKGLMVAIRIATASQWLLNIAQYAMPIVWIVAGIAAVIAAVVLMVKYWKPITAFFGKVWQGIKAVFMSFWNYLKKFGVLLLLPLMPFAALPILIIRNWDKIKAFFSGLWTFIKNIATKMFDAGKNIVKSIWDGIKAMANKPVEAIKNIIQKIRNFLPFSPAKEGPFKDLHRVRIIETIAATMKPAPMVRAMAGTMNAVAGSGRTSFASRGSVGGFSYAPVINFTGSATAQDKEDMRKILRDNADYLYKLMQQKQARNQHLSY